MKVVRKLGMVFWNTHYMMTEYLVNLGRDELKDDLLASELVVDGLEGLELVVDVSSILRVEDDLVELGTADLVSDTLASDFSWVDKVFEHGVVNSGEGSGSRSLLGLSRTTTWLWKDASLSEEDNVTVRELLFKLTGESLLDAVDGLEERNWDEDDNGLLTTRNFDLTGTLELDWTEVSLQVSRRLLEVQEGLGNLKLELRWLVVEDLIGGRHVVVYRCVADVEFSNLPILTW